MNVRSEWNDNSSDDILNRFYSKEETIAEVMENFDIRRHYSTEGKQLTINGLTDWCLVQTSGNPLRELDDHRKITCPITMTVRCGDYVLYENAKWLIDTNVVNVDGAYISARMNKCSYTLKWQNKSGEIIERDVVTYNASSYNNGVTEGRFVEIGSDQLMILLPFDEETKFVQRGKKFFIDNNPDEPTTYVLTRTDRTTYVSNGVGYIQWLVTECMDTASAEDIKHGICDYISVLDMSEDNDDSLDWHLDLDCKSLSIKPLDQTHIISAHLYDGNNMEITNDVEYDWQVSSNINKYVKFNIVNNSIELSLSSDCDLYGELITVSCMSKHTGHSDKIQLEVTEVW